MREIWSVLIGIIIWILILPIMVVTLLPFFILRLAVQLIVKAFYPYLQPLNPCDHIGASLGDDRKNSPQFVVGILRIQGNLNISELRRHFTRTFLKDDIAYPMFHQYFVFVFGYLFKKRIAKIDLEFHIREIVRDNLVRDFDTILHEVVEDTSQLIEAVPPWECILIQNSIEQRSILVLKVHHGICDGYSLVHLLDKLTENKSPYAVKDHNYSILKKLWIFLKSPLIFLNRTMSFPFFKHPSIFIDHQLTKGWRYFNSTTTLDYRAIQSIRKHTDVRVTPILISLKASALHRYLQESGLVKNCRMSIEVGYTLPVPKHPVVFNSRICNHCSIGFDRVYLNDEDLLIRLQKIQTTFQSYQEENMDYIFYKVGWLTYIFPNWMIRTHFQNMFQRSGCTFQISSLILSPERYTILGTSVENVYFNLNATFYKEATSIGLTTFTRGNEMDICFRASNDLFKTQDCLDHFVKNILPAELKKTQELCERETEKALKIQIIP